MQYSTTSNRLRTNGSARDGVYTVDRLIGKTPLLHLRAIGSGLPENVSLYGKAEFFNPGGSVKDRPARAMIRQGLENGLLTSDRTLIDATSGNTGIAYAMLCAALRIPVKLAMPANASSERKKLLAAYGAEVVLTDPMEGTDGAQEFVKKLVESRPNEYYYPDQYNNDANWLAHYEGTGQEIWEDTAGAVTHFVAGLGTTGTFTGVSRYLGEKSPQVIRIAVQPDSPLHGMEGLKHLETALVPGIYDGTLVDQHMAVSTEEAHEMTVRLSREEGLMVGVSSGAAVAAAVRIAETIKSGTVVTVLCDRGERYLSDHFWSEY